MDIGDTIDQKYELVRLIGKGGMGAVYEGRHKGTGRRVAIKLITAAYLEPNDARVIRFQREARAAGAIESQHIAQVLDCGEDAKTNTPYLVIEYLEGEDLQSLIDKNGPLEPEVALRIVGQACVALQKAHAAGVVHRDIKPANVFLARRDQGEVVVKLLDFGIAKIKADQQKVTQTSGGLTSTGSLVGSPLYMAPEQLRDAKDVDQRADIWSLGIVLYCALSGAPPLAGIDSFVDLLMAIAERDPDPVSAGCSWVSEEISALCEGAAKINPDARYPNATVFLERIKAIIGSDLHLSEAMLVPLPGDRKKAAPRAVAPDAPTLAGSAPGLASAAQDSGSLLSDSAAGASRPGIDRPSSPVMVQVRPSSPGGEPRITVVPAGSPGALANALSDTSAEEMGHEATAPLVGAPELLQAIAQRPDTAVPAPISGRVSAVPSVQAPKTPVWVWPLIAVVGLLGIGLLAFVFVRNGASSPVAPAPLSSSLPVSKAASSGTAALPEQNPRQVMKLSVVPADASVEVEGKPAVVKDGFVEMEGTLGSVFRVRVFKGAQQSQLEVVLTERGPIPSKIELKK